MATEQDSGKPTDYLLGYLQDSSPSHVGYFFRNVYFSQPELRNRLTPTNVKQSLGSFVAVESDYLEQLGNKLQTNGQALQEEALQRNIWELAKLTSYINICVGNLKEKQEVKLSQNNLKKVVQLIKVAFL